MSKVSIIAAEFNKDLIEKMVGVAVGELERIGIRSPHIVRVPGCYEAPFAANILLAKPDVSGLVVLGYIEKGETLHGEVMGHVVHRALVELQLRFLKPMGLGIIGPGATKEQAVVRHQNCAKAAVMALERLLNLR
ncbi:MAG: 6,7-dimethyl-8-ribityllumazine synthase [Bdellovibrio sp.]|nr:MAG: 6,7-dimethyl-8-ribityllumazine synthase [Bdellovibrio sp.]